jgi:outer membrane protein OmpA-like peptidoglycan-associated protein
MSKFGKFLVGLGLSLLIGLVAHFWHRDQIAADLTKSAQSELDAAYMTWAKISFVDSGARYRTGVITGTPPTPESAEEARQIILRKYSNHSFSWNNMLRGGVHKVILRATAQSGPAAPYIWRGEVVGAQVVLKGDVPNDAIRVALIAHAKSVFANKGLAVVDEMTIRANPPAGDWIGAAKRGLNAIGSLGNEFTELNDASLSVVGLAKTKAQKDSIEADINSIAGGGFTPAPAITLAAETVSPVVTAEVGSCQEDINALMATSTINFDTGRASLQQSPDPLLDKLAAVAAKCPNTNIAITGHTDKRGNDDANMRLSDARAETVQAYLVGKGIAAARLSAKGMGETQPLDPAETPDAYEKNRRIEFAVTASSN